MRINIQHLAYIISQLIKLVRSPSVCLSGTENKQLNGRQKNVKSKQV